MRHRAVANRAGLPLASTTYYFDSLDDLVACAVHHNGERELEVMRGRIRDIPCCPRSLESTADLIVDLLIGPCGADSAPDVAGRALLDDDRERLISRYERCVATARHPELRDVQLTMREQVDALLTDLLERCGRSVRERQLHRLVAVVDGAVLGGLGDLDPDPRGLARAILLDVMDTVAPPADP